MTKHDAGLNAGPLKTKSVDLEVLGKKFDEYHAEAKGAVDAVAELKKALETERKEREELEARMNRNGTSRGNDEPDPAPERKALGLFVRSGNEAELKSMSVGSDAVGGYFVHPVMSQTMTIRMRDLSPMRNLARVETITTGDSFEEIDDRDEVEAEWVGESQARPATDHAEIDYFKVPVGEIYANVPVTQRLLNDADRDIGGWVEGKIADKFGRSEGTAFITGDGLMGKPRGLLTYDAVTDADFTRAPGKLQYVPSGVADGFAESNPGDIFRTLLWKLRAPYRKGASWLMNSNTASLIDKFKNGTGDYIWRDGMTAGAPPSLLGYPVEFDENMPDVGAGNFPIAFGNFKLGYIIVDKVGIKYLRDPFTNKPNVMFYAYRRVGGGLANDDAIKLLKIAAS